MGTAVLECGASLVDGSSVDAVVDVTQITPSRKYYGRHVTPFEVGIECPEVSTQSYDYRLDGKYGTQAKTRAWGIGRGTVRIADSLTGFAPLSSPWERLVHRWNYLSINQQKLLTLGMVAVPAVALGVYLFRK